MRHNTTLPLFADDMLPITPKASHPGLPAAWSARQRENFTWWCQNGNTDMCAAVLWRGEGFSTPEARTLVKMLHASPPCAHFASHMSPNRGHAA
mgnify:CR=1 FL=1